MEWYFMHPLNKLSEKKGRGGSFSFTFFFQFLGASPPKKLRKATISFVMSVRLVRQHEKTWLPPEGFL
jgi:hypothetical protein